MSEEMLTTRRPSLTNFDNHHEKMDFGQGTHVELAYEAGMENNRLDSIEDTPTGRFVWLIAICASIGGSLFGYDTGIISAVLVYLGNDLGGKMSSGQLEAITSLCSGGAFIGAIIAGVTADRYGRKMGIYVG